MDETPKTCPKCQGEMIRGFMPDAGYGAVFVGRWHKGEPQSSFWKGTKVSDEDTRPLRALCCSACGFVELYAESPPSPEESGG